MRQLKTVVHSSIKHLFQIGHQLQICHIIIIILCLFVLHTSLILLLIFLGEGCEEKMRGKISEECEEDNDIVIHNCKKNYLSFLQSSIRDHLLTIYYYLISYVLFVLLHSLMMY